MKQMKQIAGIVGVACAFALGTANLAAAQVALVSSATEQFVARAGEEYTGVARVRNMGAVPQEAKVYLADYRPEADGRARFPEPGSSTRSNAPWITVSPSRLVIPPGETVDVSYRVTVPADAPLSGSYWSMLMIEGIPSSSDESAHRTPSRGRTEVAIRATVRYGVQLVTHVGESGEAKIEIKGTRVEAAEKGRRLTFDILNTGGRASTPVVRVEVFDATGTNVHTVEQRKGLLLPESALRQQVDLGTLPTGSYEVLVVVDTGGDEVVGAQYTLQI
jgi:hypothetical protein